MLVFAGLILFLILLMQPLTILRYREYIGVLFPVGIIGIEERNLLLIIQALMLLVVIPVYILTFVFSWKYRADNPNSNYDPDLVDSKLAETIWWGIPFVMTAVVALITWVKTHELDPFKPIASEKKPLTVQAVALQWKWLFIYPEQKIASLNFLQVPKSTPIHFEITADAPMNSLWIPHWGGQIYAMPKMKTELKLISDEVGDFRGSSANISGKGFAGMHFVARSSSEEDFEKWVKEAKASKEGLDYQVFNKLVEPSENNPVTLYQLKDDKLFEQIIMKYMHPQEHE